MFIGSLVASRFLGLIAHFVVTVVIFLSKVSFYPNRRSSVMFMFGCLLHEFTVISFRGSWWFDSESFLQITFRTQMLKLACLFSIQKANFHLRTKSKCVKFFKKLHFRQNTPQKLGLCISLKSLNSYRHHQNYTITNLFRINFDFCSIVITIEVS